MTAVIGGPNPYASIGPSDGPIGGAPMPMTPAMTHPMTPPGTMPQGGIPPGSNPYNPYATVNPYGAEPTPNFVPNSGSFNRNTTPRPTLPLGSSPPMGAAMPPPSMPPMGSQPMPPPMSTATPVTAGNSISPPSMPLGTQMPMGSQMPMRTQMPAGMPVPMPGTNAGGSVHQPNGAPHNKLLSKRIKELSDYSMNVTNEYLEKFPTNILQHLKDELMPIVTERRNGSNEMPDGSVINEKLVKALKDPEASWVFKCFWRCVIKDLLDMKTVLNEERLEWSRLGTEIRNDSSISMTVVNESINKMKEILFEKRRGDTPLRNAMLDDKDGLVELLEGVDVSGLRDTLYNIQRELEAWKNDALVLVRAERKDPKSYRRAICEGVDWQLPYLNETHMPGTGLQGSNVGTNMSNRPQSSQSYSPNKGRLKRGQDVYAHDDMEPHSDGWACAKIAAANADETYEIVWSNKVSGHKSTAKKPFQLHAVHEDSGSTATVIGIYGITTPHTKTYDAAARHHLIHRPAHMAEGSKKITSEYVNGLPQMEGWLQTEMQNESFDDLAVAMRWNFFWFEVDGFTFKMWDSYGDWERASVTNYKPFGWWDLRRCFKAESEPEAKGPWCKLFLYFPDGALHLRAPSVEEAERWELGVNCLVHMHKTGQVMDDSDRMPPFCTHSLKMKFEQNDVKHEGEIRFHDAMALVHTLIAQERVSCMVKMTNLGEDASVQEKLKALETAQDKLCGKDLHNLKKALGDPISVRTFAEDMPGALFGDAAPLFIGSGLQGYGSGGKVNWGDKNAGCSIM